ncbi:MAG TPA: helicase C-terminal domain-containing protein [Opitutaceae bacterium]|nr:helicase C-terminal domain-containing protein [Opitutaceae bacterium]
MHFDLATRIVTLGVGELAGFSLGPRESAGGAGGLWRAQLGQHWHTEHRHRAAEEPGARFEVPITGDYHHRGWTFRLSGRIDQYFPSPAGGVRLRELKTVTRPLPAPEPELQAEYPDYFVQLAAYLVLHALAPEAEPARGELVFVEASSGLVQIVAAPAESTAILHGQLDELVAFLDARRRAAERRRGLPVRPAFASFRPGQEHVQRDLRTALGLDLFSGVAPLARAVNSEVGRTVPSEPPPSGNPQSAFHNPPSPSVLCFEAPTGFGKTGCLLEFALTGLKEGVYDRVIYLTGKSTGQLQVVQQLKTMLAPQPDPVAPLARAANLESSPISAPETLNPKPGTAAKLPVWQVRSKAEHCVNTVYHCLPDACPFLRDAAERWPRSGLARFYLLDGEPRDLESLRAAGRAALICPYEITRAALPFNDVWVGDYNYVFAPANRGVFFEQPAFDPSTTLLIVDEAHNLAARVADAYSHTVRAGDAWSTYDALRSARAPATFVLAWEAWARELDDLRPCEALDGATEIGLRAAARRLAELVPATALDFVALGPAVSELLWQLPQLDEFLDAAELPKLLWCPARGELRVTCLDAANAIAATLREFRHAILTSATLNPLDAFATACGLDRAPVAKAAKASDSPAPPPVDLAATLGKLPRGAKKTLRGLTTGSALLRVEEDQTAPPVPFLRADTPWRRGAYRVAVDTRVDTRWERRTHHFEVTAATVAQLCAAAGASMVAPLARAATPVAVFFPSYAYADSVAQTCAASHPALRIAQQPRGLDLAKQAEFIESALASSDAVFLVLGTGYTEGIDLLGGRVTHAMVVGPALPEVNAVQRAKLAQCSAKGRDAAFRLVYQVPGMQKVNQALGRLVRAPGHRATVLLHCRRFAEASYRELLDPELQAAPALDSDELLAAWLAGHEIVR